MGIPLLRSDMKSAETQLPQGSENKKA